MVHESKKLFWTAPDQTPYLEPMFLAGVPYPKTEQFMNRGAIGVARTEDGTQLSNGGREQKGSRKLVRTFLLLWSHFLFFSGAEEGDDTAIALHASIGETRPEFGSIPNKDVQGRDTAENGR
jgi:hypothetical protein